MTAAKPNLLKAARRRRQVEAHLLHLPPVKVAEIDRGWGKWTFAGHPYRPLPEYGGRDYLIGPRFREGEQGYAHELTNQLSGLTLHAIQIRVSYLADPEGAKQASKTKEKLTADLHTKMAAAGQAAQIPILMCLRGPRRQLRTARGSGRGLWPGRWAGGTRAVRREVEGRRPRGSHRGASRAAPEASPQLPSMPVRDGSLLFLHLFQLCFTKGRAWDAPITSVLGNSQIHTGTALPRRFRS